MKLLYRTAEWHSLAKLRMHTESTLALLESLTTEFGLLMQNFQELTCSQFATTELPRETAARNRRDLNNSAAVLSRSNIDQVTILNHHTTASTENITVPTPTVGSDRKYQTHE